MKKIAPPSFADLAVARRKIKTQFFSQINQLVDWRLISNIINKHYTKGISPTGQPAYEGLLLFKMTLLQTWYGLSDYELEERLNDSISFSRFCGLSLQIPSPDHSTVSRFRTEMTQKGAYEKLLKALNKQLEKHKIIVKTGAIVDASIIDSPLKPKGKPTYELVDDRPKEEEELEIKSEKDQTQGPTVVKIIPPGVDTQAAWVIRAGKLRYGYKKHVVTDEEGMILGVVTTPANVNEISNLATVLESANLPKHIPLKADKGYQSKKNAEVLKTNKLKNHILKKAGKGKKLGPWEVKFNKLVGKVRYKVERTFAGIKRWFNVQGARYRGINKMHTQNLMEAMAYNLYRSPGIVMSNCKK
jgi:IS5 family transposase